MSKSDWEKIEIGTFTLEMPPLPLEFGSIEWNSVNANVHVTWRRVDWCLVGRKRTRSRWRRQGRR